MKTRHYFIIAAGSLTIAFGLYRIAFSHESSSTASPSTAVVASTRMPVNASASAAPAKKLETHERAPNPVEEMKRRLEDPRQHEANLNRAKLNVEESYGRLFHRLRNLPPDVLGRLKLALAEKQLGMERRVLLDQSRARGVTGMAGTPSVDQVQKESEDQIHGLLGDEAYAQYNSYQQSEPYRGSIENTVSTMRSRGLDVSEELQERILDGYSSAVVDATRISASETTPEAFASMSESTRQELRAKQQARYDQILADTMSKILGPDEFKVFMESESASGG